MAQGFVGAAPSRNGHRWHDGWTAGGGVMVQLGDGLSIGAEYNYVDLEKRTYGVEIVAPGDVADIDHMIHVFKVTGTVRLNPLFGGF